MNVFSCLNRVATLLIAGTFAIVLASPVYAQATRTWVSGVGDDVNPCSRTAPCKTFAGAISKTATNGEISCLDPGGFGAVTITKSISIVCDYTHGSILASATTGVLVNAPANSIVMLRGINIECAVTGIHGVRIIGTGAVVHINKTQIRGCRGGGSGVTVNPSSGLTDVYIADSYITDNGTTNILGGINVIPTGTANVNLTVNRTQIENNTNGVRADSSGTSGFIRGTVRDSLVGGGTFTGIAAITTASVTNLQVDRVSVVNNATGMSTSGAQASLFVRDTVVTANDTGLSVPTGAIFSYRNNSVGGNIVADGAFTSQITMQ